MKYVPRPQHTNVVLEVQRKGSTSINDPEIAPEHVSAPQTVQLGEAHTAGSINFPGEHKLHADTPPEIIIKTGGGKGGERERERNRKGTPRRSPPS